MKSKISKDINWVLIRRVLSNEANQSEKKEFQQWLEFDNNMMLFKKIQTIWEHKIEDEIELDIDIERALHSLKDKIKIQQTNKLRKINFLKIAASVVFVSSMIFLLTDNEILNKGTIVSISSDDQKIIDLPDGTKVYLNNDSKIEYHTHFEKNVREVELTGEAFFEVTPNVDKPFLIKANNTITRVLGTSFNIKVNDLKNVELIVETGKVSFGGINKNEKVLLSPGDKAIYVESKASIYKAINDDPNYDSWKTKILVFQGTKLSDVLQMISNVYSVHIDVSDSKINECRLSGRFDNQSLEEILKAISLTFNLQITYKNEKYQLHGNGC